MSAHQKATHYASFHGVLTALLLSVLVNLSYANTGIDSLKQELRKNPLSDSLFIDICIELGVKYESVNGDSTLFYYKQAEETALKNKWFKRVGDVCLNRSFYYHYQQRSDTGFYCVRQAIKYYKQVAHQDGIINALFTMGTYSSNFDRFDSAIYFLQEAKELGEQYQDSTHLHLVYNNLGLMYHYVGVYDLSIDNTLLAITYKEKLGKADVSSSYLNLGLSYSSNELEEEAIYYTKKALELFKSNNQMDGVALATQNIGAEYANLEQYDSAFAYYDKSFNMFKMLNDSNSMARTFLMRSKAEVEQENFKGALEYAKTGLSYYPKSNPNLRLKIGLFQTLSRISYDLAVDGNLIYLKQAETYAKDALQLAQNIGLKEFEANALQLLFNIYNKQQNYKQAAETAEAYHTVRDSLNSAERSKYLTEQQIRFETEKKAIEIEGLNRENELKSASLAKSEELRSQQQIIIWLLAGGVVLFGVLIVVIFILYRQRSVYAKELVANNALISSQKEEKEVLLKEIHHRVKNNLQVVIALLELQGNAINDESFSSAVSMSQQRIRSMALIHELLYQNEDVGVFDFESYVKNLVQQIKGSYANRNEVEYTLQLDNEIQFDLDTAIPLGLIITEIFTNAIKYGKSNSEKIQITIISKAETSNTCLLILKDNGPGLPTDFDWKTSNSLGIRLVHKLAKQLQGKVAYQYDDGATFFVSFTHKL